MLIILSISLLFILFQKMLDFKLIQETMLCKIFCNPLLWHIKSQTHPSLYFVQLLFCTSLLVFVIKKNLWAMELKNLWTCTVHMWMHPSTLIIKPN